MPTRILYLHGFASSPNGEKVRKLRDELGPAHELVAPDLNAPSFAELDFGAIVERALAAALDARPDVIVGSSLGSLVALSVARRGVDAPLVLIAPAFGIADRWLSKLPDGDPITVFHHATGGDEEIHRAFFLDMASLTIDREPPAAPVTVFMGRLDESVPYERVESTWHSWERSGRLAQGSRFIEIADGDHRLVDHTTRIADEIRRATGAA